MKHARPSDARPLAAAFNPATQDKKRRLLFRNRKTGERVMLDGGTFGEYCELLAWDPANVDWSDKERSRHDRPVYQTAGGWAPIVRPIHPSLQREEVG